MSDEVDYCYICGIKIKDDYYTRIVYPPYEFKAGKACFSCGKRQQEKNMVGKGLKK